MCIEARPSMRSTLGAPLGGTTSGGQQGLDSWALMLIVPPNFGGGAGRVFPSIVVVASGEHGVAVVCWAAAELAAATRATANIAHERTFRFGFISAPLRGCFGARTGVW